VKLLADSGYMAMRHIRNLIRQPWYVAFTLVQPIIYLGLFSSLFQKVVEIPGFGSHSYLAFLTPGIAVMSALFSSGWNGMSIIRDLDRGVMDRFLVSPVSRSSLILGRLIQLALAILVQSIIIIGLGYLRGARFSDAVLGIPVLIVCAILLAIPFGALSNGIALLTRQEESLIGAANFVLLPLTFLSSVFMASNLMPSWMRSIAQFNPLNWAAQAGREALTTNVDWGYVLLRLGWLVALSLAFGWFATLAFKTYQRSI